MKRVGPAPCQWSSPGSKNTRSPGRMTSTGPPRRCARPTPSVTKMVWPLGCVCHAVRAPGVKWTLLALRRDGSAGVATVSTYTAPVNHSLDPFVVCAALLRVTFIGKECTVSNSRVVRGRTNRDEAARELSCDLEPQVAADVRPGDVNIPATRMRESETGPDFVARMIPVRATMDLRAPRKRNRVSIGVGDPKGKVPRAGHPPHNLDFFSGGRRHGIEEQSPQAAPTGVQPDLGKATLRRLPFVEGGSMRTA